MDFDIRKIDQSKFQTFKLNDGSIYYGESILVDSNGKITTEKEQETIPEEEKLPIRRVRHGAGINLFPDYKLSGAKYIGYWDMDKKSGKGQAYFPDKTVYKGEFNNDQFHGYGSCKWGNGEIYDGEWVKNKMFGPGVYINKYGTTFKGEFINNMYRQPNENRLINPLLNEEEIKKFNSKSIEFSDRENATFNKKPTKIYKISNFPEFHLMYDEVKKNSKFPLFLKMEKSNSKKIELYELIKQKEQFFDEIDYREYASKIWQKLLKDQASKELKERLVNAMLKAGLILINIDSNKSNYKELFDPDIREFYHSNCILIEFWRPDEMIKEKIWGTYSQEKFPLSPYRIAMKSKFRISPEWDDLQILEKVNKRFKNSFPLNNFDIIVINSLKFVEEKHEEKKDEEAEETKEEKSEKKDKPGKSEGKKQAKDDKKSKEEKKSSKEDKKQTAKKDIKKK